MRTIALIKRGIPVFASIILVMLPAVSGWTNEITQDIYTDPVKIDTGYISGTVIGDVGKEVHIYRGIPYAAPPVGDLRWKPPQPAVPWQGIREATAFGKSSPQDVSQYQSLRSIIGDIEAQMSEDCLNLNVLTPAKRASDNLPVMVWLHGGGYTAGSGNQQVTNRPRLPQHGVVLVTVTTRLNSIGLLAHPLLSRESPNGVSGNYLFLDLIAALKWVQKNIAAFGGNPENITIFGQSGGGWKATCLTASPMAKGLFHRAIFQSGAAATLSPGAALSPGMTMKDLEAIGEKFFARLGVDKEADPLKAARALPWKKILEAEASLKKEIKRVDSGIWDAAIDLQFLMDFPEKVFSAGKQNPVPIITSADLGELIGPGSGLVPIYVNMLNSVNKIGQKGYAYIFDQVPGKWKQEGCISFHGLDFDYVFGYMSDPNDKYFSDPLHAMMSVSSAMQAGAKSPDPGFTDVDRKVSEAMMTMFAQFARTGNPSVKGQVDWPTYDSATDQYLYISDTLQAKSGFSKVAQPK